MKPNDYWITATCPARKIIWRGNSRKATKKLELAIALAGQPKLLLLDEPTAGMSLEETRETMALVDKLNAELGLSESDFLVR